jgi:putative ABC transport system ATP-binding protein
MITVQELGRDFVKGGKTITVLDGITLSINDREFLAITGPSGSGKSTLLGLLAGLDRPTRGTIIIDGEEITALSENDLSRLRGRKMGFIFQSFQLIPTLTAIENVRVPAEINGDRRAASRAEELLKRVGLSHRMHHYPSQLSGGEMQRVAIARAYITRPKILFADEPAGNLDSVNGTKIMEMLMEMNEHSTLILVTHNPDLARMSDREIRLRDGRIEKRITHRKRGSIQKSKSRK